MQEEGKRLTSSSFSMLFVADNNLIYAINIQCAVATSSAVGDFKLKLFLKSSRKVFGTTSIVPVFSLGEKFFSVVFLNAKSFFGVFF